jgi:hypothetical protein
MHVTFSTRTTLAIVLALCCLVGCSSSTDSPAPVCVAGITQSCLCVAARAGVQSCKDDGSGFGVCDCGGDTGLVDAAVDSSSSDATDSAVDDTYVSETLGDTIADMTDGGTDAPSDAGAGAPTARRTRKAPPRRPSARTGTLGARASPRRRSTPRSP